MPIAMLVGFVGGLIVSNGGSGDSGIDPADEYQEQAMDFALFAETHFADVSAGMAIDTQVWGYTQMYWDRVAEVAAAARWSEETDVEPLINAILNDAAVMESMAVIYRSWESVIDTPLYGMSDIPVLNDAVVAEMTCVGSLLIIGLGLNMLGVTKLKVMNYVPAVFVAIGVCYLF